MALVKLNNRGVRSATTFGSITGLGSMVFIKKQTASSSSTISFVDGTSDVVLDDTYKEYIFTFKDIHLSSASGRFQFNGTTDGTSIDFSNTGTYDDGYETKMQSATEGSTGLSISADAVEGATSFTINGSTDRTESAVTLTVVAPNGNIVTVDQLSPGSDGAFSSEIGVGGPMWSQDGIYTVTAIQGDATAYQSTVEIDIADGAVIPEFGTVASLVLVIAITSIIILSAKGRLSIAPKL